MASESLPLTGCRVPTPHPVCCADHPGILRCSTETDSTHASRAQHKAAHGAATANQQQSRTAASVNHELACLATLLKAL